ncbi:META domain-containing protein [Sphingomonas sp. 3-13AW]|uniref:META domain-containing protein n=1 Tax=Sphingomonas sp. 3-13AW TaxID=3050450 RepID=UPI003BB55D78
MRNLVTLAVAGLLASGCATTATSDSGALTGSEWRITQIGGVDVTPNSHAAIGFGADGRFYGNASCNRMSGTYRVDGSALSLNSAGLTRMLCDPAEMEQERELVELLGQVSSYQIGPGGSLVLTTRSGAHIVASR